MPAFKNQVDSVMERQKTVNILFVLDATDDMGAYFPAIAKAILAFSSSKADTTKEIRYAALYYRDASEGAFLWDHTRRRTSAEDVAGWINNVTALVRDDQDEPEAVFFGLKEALQLNHLEPNETNVVILIGDAGNHAQTPDTDIPPGDIVNLLLTYPAHFFGIQVRHPATDPAYDEFIPQLRDEILTPLVQERLAQISQFDSTIAVAWETTVGQSGNHFIMHQGNSYINHLFELEKGAEMAPEELTIRLQEILGEVVQETEKRVEDLQLLKTAETLDPSQMDAASVFSILKNNNIPLEQLEYLKPNRSQGIQQER